MIFSLILWANHLALVIKEKIMKKQILFIVALVIIALSSCTDDPFTPAGPNGSGSNNPVISGSVQGSYYDPKSGVWVNGQVGRDQNGKWFWRISVGSGGGSYGNWGPANMGYNYYFNQLPSQWPHSFVAYINRPIDIRDDIAVFNNVGGLFWDDYSGQQVACNSANSTAINASNLWNFTNYPQMPVVIKREDAPTGGIGLDGRNIYRYKIIGPVY